MLTVVLDNDILIKGSAYELLNEFIQVVPASNENVGVLAASRFIVPTRLNKQIQAGECQDSALAQFHELIQYANFLEPTEEEGKIAAELELAAQQQHLPLDAGESQLLAILISRSLNSLVTGDKRAIGSIETMHPGIGHPIQGKIICLEQISLRLVEILGDRLRTCICNVPKIDKTLTMCFSCTNPNSKSADWVAGLNSYINDIRKQASTVLSS